MILVAEDQAITALEIKTLLKLKGFSKVMCFSKGKNAIEYISGEHPSFAILDIKLADDISGLEIAKILKQESIPFIFISAFSDPEYFKNARALNPIGIIIKPFDDSELNKILDDIQGLIS